MQLKIKENVDKILKILEKNNITETLIQVGSSTRCEEYHDIDLLMIVEKKDKIINKIEKIFKNYKTTKIDDSIKILNYLDVEVSFAIYEKNYFINLIDNYNKGNHIICEHKTWSIGYWLIEGFIEDIKKGIVLVDNHNIKNLKKILSKKSIYGEIQILNECLEEINLKSKLLNNKSTEESNYLKQDIYLATLRAFSIIIDCPLKGFKNINEKINKFPKELKKIITNLFLDSNIEKAISIIEENLKRTNNLYMGTWQFNGQFKPLSEKEIINLLNFAKKSGIKKFDTALVYGLAEKCISKIIDNESIVLTKIPAKRKPSLEEDENINENYTEEYINECINKSLTNLQRDYVDIILLHNWNYHWDNSVISYLIELKNKGIVKKIGISLPNNYNRRLNEEILYDIDVIEAPYNKENKWIEKDIEFYKKYNIEIILRSLFLQGKSLNKNKTNYIKYIKEANKFNTSLVIGMTTEEQIINNINCLVGDKYE